MRVEKLQNHADRKVGSGGGKGRAVRNSHLDVE